MGVTVYGPGTGSIFSPLGLKNVPIPFAARFKFSFFHLRMSTRETLPRAGLVPLEFPMRTGGNIPTTIRSDRGYPCRRPTTAVCVRRPMATAPPRPRGGCASWYKSNRRAARAVRSRVALRGCGRSSPFSRRASTASAAALPPIIAATPADMTNAPRSSNSSIAQMQPLGKHVAA